MGDLREVNLELGKPAVKDALQRLTFEISRCKVTRIAVLKIIHGYGSTGAGGKIRVEARALLDRLKKKGEIRGYIPGERFSIFDGETLTAFSRCDALRKDPDLERHNNGVTYILL